MTTIGPDLLGRLFDEHARGLVLYARQWSESPEDVLQEAFVQLARRRARPRPDALRSRTGLGPRRGEVAGLGVLGRGLDAGGRRPGRRARPRAVPRPRTRTGPGRHASPRAGARWAGPSHGPATGD